MKVISALFGFVAGAVGSGLGSLAGGTTSNITSQLLTNGNVDWTSTATSAAASFGMYHTMSYASWKWGRGSKVGDVNIKYRTYLKMNTTLQRARAWKRERGFWINEDGTFENLKGAVYNKHGIDKIQAPSGNAKYLVHTHWQPDGMMINPIKTIAGESDYGRYANSFIPSPGDVNEINKYNVNGEVSILIKCPKKSS